MKGQIENLLLGLLALGDITCVGENTQQFSPAVDERVRVVRHHGFLAVFGACGQLVVGDLVFVQHQFDCCRGARRVGEVILERGADQPVARPAGEHLHLLVDVGDDAGRIGGDHGVDVGFDERTRVKLLVEQTLIEFFLRGLYPLACGIVGADQQVADNAVLLIA